MLIVVQALPSSFDNSTSRYRRWRSPFCYSLSGISTELVVTITVIQYQFSPQFLHGIFAWFFTITAVQYSALSHLTNLYSVPFFIFANSVSLPVRNVWYRNFWCPSPRRIGFTHFTTTKSRIVEVIMYRVFDSCLFLMPVLETEKKSGAEGYWTHSQTCQ